MAYEEDDVALARLKRAADPSASLTRKELQSFESLIDRLNRDAKNTENYSSLSDIQEELDYVTEYLNKSYKRSKIRESGLKVVKPE